MGHHGIDGAEDRKSKHAVVRMDDHYNITIQVYKWQR